jgi:hypothetical protein
MVNTMVILVTANVHSLTAVGFATCEVQRSETQQVAKPADVQADVTGFLVICFQSVLFLLPLIRKVCKPTYLFCRFVL